ncbi:copper resistance D family protein [Erwinia endophytica]|uniref:copper homeostasis membrane protein CopD n=1 Tax=Erwinia endophytica TaxID=1563158 RepID=UPI001265E430|nr:copper homeostasis membrane protein CopD [Erwinia endophytica]KAB8307884.1 copper resistance D family protein [Erwinia endophytica]
MSLSLFYFLCRWLHFTALMSLTGGSVYTALMAPARFRSYLAEKFHYLLATSAVLALLSAILLFAVQTGLMGNGWADLFNADIWQAVLQTHFGQVWRWHLMVSTAGVVALAFKGRLRQQLLLLSGTGQLMGLAFVGHAAMLDGAMGMLQRSNQAVHLIAAAFWAGGLLPVLLLMREAHQLNTRYDAIRSLMRFSRYGHLAVALVVISGIINAWLLLGWPLTSFHLYSRLLLLKTTLVVVMCAVALFNRYWLVPRFQRSGAHAQYYFMLTTLLELFLAALVLLLVSVFATQEPA